MLKDKREYQKALNALAEASDNEYTNPLYDPQFAENSEVLGLDTSNEYQKEINLLQSLLDKAIIPTVSEEKKVKAILTYNQIKGFGAFNLSEIEEIIKEYVGTELWEEHKC